MIAEIPPFPQYCRPIPDITTSKPPSPLIRTVHLSALWLWSVVKNKQLVMPDPNSCWVKGVKLRARVIFGKRGERVVGFYITQWRPIDGTYDMLAFDDFDRFVKSFKFLKKSFYETL